MPHVSIVIPAHNEAGAVASTVHAAREAFADSPYEAEIIVVDDGSSDGTAAEAEEAGAVVARHPVNLGYGNAILTGVARAQSPLIALTDADGTYPVGELPAMVAELEERKLDMLVGARQGKVYHGGTVKYLSRLAFKALSEFTVGRRIPDINSGLRVIRRSLIERFAPVSCGGFSFTTTITVTAMLTNHFVDYRPIPYFSRHGKSKVNYFRDTLRSAQILTMTIMLFNPIKLYIVLAGMLMLIGLLLLLSSLVLPGGVALYAGLFAIAVFVLLGLGFQAEQRSRIAALSRGTRDMPTRH